VGDDHAPLVVYGHDSGVLHRAHDHIGGVGGEEFLEAGAGALVGAVLGPHGIIAEQLGEGGIASQHLGNGERFGHRHTYARGAQTGLYFWIGQTDYLQFGNTSGKLGVWKAGGIINLSIRGEERVERERDEIDVQLYALWESVGPCCEKTEYKIRNNKIEFRCN